MWVCIRFHCCINVSIPVSEKVIWIRREFRLRRMVRYLIWNASAQFIWTTPHFPFLIPHSISLSRFKIVISVSLFNPSSFLPCLIWCSLHSHITTQPHNHYLTSSQPHNRTPKPPHNNTIRQPPPHNHATTPSRPHNNTTHTTTQLHNYTTTQLPKPLLRYTFSMQQSCRPQTLLSRGERT